MALIKEYILSKDGQIGSVIIQLPNKQLVSRAINHLFPLEIQATQSGSSGNLQPLRKAADQARKRITEQLNDPSCCSSNLLPSGVSWNRDGIV